jgi:hypothetical protein
MKKLILGLSFLGLFQFACEKKTTITKPKFENKTVQSIYEKLKTYKTPARIEVRNYVKDQNNKFQNDISAIKKIRATLDPRSNVYIELNLFINESDKNAPLVAQFMVFDVKTKNLIQEENLNLD